MRRRSFLGLGARLGAGLAVGFTLGGCLPVIPKRPDPTSEHAAGWITYLDGRYELILPRAEFGQNIDTALKQIACDELGIEWHELSVRPHDTNHIEHVRATVGSDLIKDYALPLAQACATLRQALAAGTTSGRLNVGTTTELRAFSAKSRFVGKPATAASGPSIVTGAPLFAGDMRRPGMAFGRVLRASTSPELRSRPKQWNAVAARDVPGFVALIEDDRLRQGNSLGLGIIAETPGGLERIAEALDIGWHIEGSFAQADLDLMLDIDARLADGDLAHELADDPVDRKNPWDVDLRLDIPLAAHAPIEPRTAVAEFTDGRLRAWVGSQDAFYVRDVLAQACDLDPNEVTVNNRRIGGAFGGKTLCTVELEAAVLAQAAGRPVKVQWTRAQELQQGFHRSASSHRLRARLRDGRISDWWHAFASGHILFTNAAMPPWMQKVADVIGDKGVARGALPPYRLRRRRVEHDLIRLPVLTGPWRGLGAGPNVLAVELLMDECARHAGADPIDFRLNHLDDQRLIRVIRRVAADADYAAAARKGRGFACGVYKGMSYAAALADVDVDIGAGGEVTVERIWCAHDCGRVINPDQVRAQCEGNIVWGLGLVLRETLPVAAGGIDAADFADSPIPLFGDIPDLRIALVDGGEPPSGAGETAIVAASGAILNAIRDATGRRPRRLPVKPEDLLDLKA